MNAHSAIGSAPLIIALCLSCAGSPTRSLHRAAQRGDLDEARAILESGDPVDLNSYRIGTTPLLTATYHGHERIVELLLVNGANPDLTDQRLGLAPLHWAASKAYPEIAEELLHFGADPNVSSRKGDTPLHTATATGSEQVVRLLLANGADSQLRGADGRSAIDIARSMVRKTTESTEDAISASDACNVPQLEEIRAIASSGRTRIDASEGMSASASTSLDFEDGTSITIVHSCPTKLRAGNVVPPWEISEQLEQRALLASAKLQAYERILAVLSESSATTLQGAP